MAGFDPSEPRDKDGQWTTGGGLSTGDKTSDRALGTAPLHNDTNFVARPQGWKAASDDVVSLTRSGHFYRGMTEAEYNDTLGAGKGVVSNKSFSLSGEGTSFASDAQTSESYVNYGRSDPRESGKPTYLVEVKATPDIKAKPDGYYHATDVVPPSVVTRVWKMSAKDGAVVARKIK